MSAFKDLSIALNQKLQAYSTANSRSVAWENVEFNPTTSTMYLRPTVLPAASVQAGLGSTGQELHQGIFQIDVFAKIDESKSIALAEADAIADYFARGTTLTYNGVNVRLGTASNGSGIRDSGWFIVPVFINYLSFTQAR
jgi:hypothetical protein